MTNMTRYNYSYKPDTYANQILIQTDMKVTSVNHIHISKFVDQKRMKHVLPIHALLITHTHTWNSHTFFFIIRSVQSDYCSFQSPVVDKWDAEHMVSHCWVCCVFRLISLWCKCCVLQVPSHREWCSSCFICSALFHGKFRKDCRRNFCLPIFQCRFNSVSHFFMYTIKRKLLFPQICL